MQLDTGAPSGLVWTFEHFTEHWKLEKWKKKKKRIALAISLTRKQKNPQVSCICVEPLHFVRVCVFCIWHSRPRSVILSRWLTLLSKYEAVNYHLTAALYAELPTEQDHRAQRDTTTLVNKLDSEAKPGETERTKVIGKKVWEDKEAERWENRKQCNRKYKLLTISDLEQMTNRLKVQPPWGSNPRPWG